MAEDAAGLPWDDQTGVFVNEIDADTSKKYNISLKKLLLNPGEFANVDKIAETVDKIKTDVGAYFDDLLSNLKDEEDELTKQLEAADAVHTQINQTIGSRAGIARVPFIRPIDFEAGDSNPETVYIDKYDGQLDMLITKLINGANYVCDLSVSYRKYSIGSWLFSGSRSCQLAVKSPESVIISIESSRDAILSMLDDVSDRFLEA